MSTARDYAEARLDDFLSQFDEADQERILRYALDHIVPRMKRLPQPGEGALTGWQSIDSAPKDGRKLILFYRNRNGKARKVIARWVTDEEAAETDADDVGLEGGWYECIDNWDDYCQVTIHEGEPTHWMPLPEPPGIPKESEHG